MVKTYKQFLEEGKLPGSGKQTFSWKSKDRTKTGVMVVGRDKSKRKPIKLAKKQKD